MQYWQELENGAVIKENSMEMPQKVKLRDFPGGTVVKNRPANAGNMGSIHGPEDPTCLSTMQQRVAPALCTWRKLACSNEDSAQPKINKKF